MGAAGNGDRNAAVVKLLIEHGAAINARSGDTLEVVKNGAPSGLGHVTALRLASGMANYERRFVGQFTQRFPKALSTTKIFVELF